VVLEVNLSVILTGIVTALIFYLIRVVLLLDKKVSVLTNEIEHLKRHIDVLDECLRYRFKEPNR